LAMMRLCISYSMNVMMELKCIASASPSSAALIGRSTCTSNARGCCAYLQR
jgi:hypothetical protein